MPLAVGAAALIVTLGAGAAIYVAPALLVGVSVLVWRGTALRPRRVAVLGWDLFAGVNAGLAALAFSVVPQRGARASRRPDHTQEAAIALLAARPRRARVAAGAARQPGVRCAARSASAWSPSAVVVLVRRSARAPRRG